MLFSLERQTYTILNLVSLILVLMLINYKVRFKLEQYFKFETIQAFGLFLSFH